MEEIKQMEISYHREMKNNYLMIAVEEARERGFEARMLIGNTIDGLLKFRIRKSDNRCQFCYEITSKQPLGRLLETKAIGADQIRRLLLGIAQTLTRMEDYLLSEDQILLDPDFIYVDLENFQPGLCLIPGRKGDFPQEFSELLRFLLGKVDHQDKDAVVLVYGLYRESLKDNYGLDNLLRWLVKEDCSNHESEKSEPAMEKTSQDLLVATDVPVTGAGTYTVALDFTGTAAGFANGVTFCAVGIGNGEKLFPNYVMHITSVKINGEEVKMEGLAYTTSDDAICTRVNLYNEWVTSVPAEARSMMGSTKNCTPCPMDKAAFGEVKTLEVTFRYIKK